MGDNTHKSPCTECERTPNTEITLKFELTAREYEILRNADDIGEAMKRAAERELYRIINEVL